MQLQMTVIDAFTDQPFKGNSAAVILLDKWLSDELMQSIAMENNLSETAFIVNTEGRHHIRWFSPLTEIAFCGHATLATAHLLFTRGNADQVTFYAKAVGELQVTRAADGLISMSFPQQAPEPVADVPEALYQGLSITPIKVLKNQQAYFAVYQDEQDVLNLETENEALKSLAPFDVVATATASQSDFVSRYFWPANGGDEDPVTGSIHTGLAPYWAEQLDKKDLVGYQASKRGGTLFCSLSDDRVVVSGYATQYLTGTIEVPEQ